MFARKPERQVAYSMPILVPQVFPAASHGVPRQAADPRGAHPRAPGAARAPQPGPAVGTEVIRFGQAQILVRDSKGRLLIEHICIT